MGRALADREKKPTTAQFLEIVQNATHAVNTSQLESLPAGVHPRDLVSASTDQLIADTQRHQQRLTFARVDRQLKKVRRVSVLPVGARVAVDVEHLPSKKSFSNAQLTVLNRKSGRRRFTLAEYIVVGVNERAEPTPTYTVAHKDLPRRPLAGFFNRAALRHVSNGADAQY